MIPAEEGDTPASTKCDLVAENDITLYDRPGLEAEIFATLSNGDRVIISGRTSDGWLGFGPGIAQAANIGPFRLRWIEGNEQFRLEGECGNIAISWGPPPGICFDMPMLETNVHAEADESSNILVTLNVGDFAAVLGKTEGNWAKVDLGLGNTGSDVSGWVEGVMLNMNGPCWDLPTLIP